GGGDSGRAADAGQGGRGDGRDRRVALSAQASRMYSPQVLDHFEHPRNAGVVADADASARIENPACGDVLELTVKVAGGRIAEIRFRAKGCVAAMACGSALTELVSGKTVGEAKKLSREQLVRAVGGLPEASSHAGHLAMDALAAVLGQMSEKI
ncbi:MAG: iron-sulfur cluster assembly scaffold protein, partial [Terracidiphilus sp.]